MTRDRWDDRWQRYPESKPIATTGGIATSKQRGAMATSWWSKRFVDVLDSYGLGSRMQRGRRYARTGQVLSVEVTAGLLVAQVQGSRPTPYLVSVRSEQPTDVAWTILDLILRSQVGFVARLLAGEVPQELEPACSDAGIQLFPARWADVNATCNCPDWENPCKHIAAVLYVFADQLDTDPWLLLRWRGRSRDELLAHLGGAASDTTSNGLPPWWPLVPGHPVAEVRRWVAPVAVPPEPPRRVMARMQPLQVHIGEDSVTDLLRVAYEVLVSRPPEE